MLAIPAKIHEAIVARAREGLPLEVCGILGGADGVVGSHFAMTNSDASSCHFSMDPKEQFAVGKELRARGEEVLAIYHSHPASPARPSQEDIRLALTPNVCHLIVSLMEPQAPVTQAYRIAEGVVEQVGVRIIE